MFDPKITIFVCHFFLASTVEEQGTEFCFRKLKFITIYNANSNKSPFKYYISILGGVGGLRPCLFAYFRVGGPEFGKTCLYNT